MKIYNQSLTRNQDFIVISHLVIIDKNLLINAPVMKFARNSKNICNGWTERSVIGRNSNKIIKYAHISFMYPRGYAEKKVLSEHFRTSYRLGNLASVIRATKFNLS